MVTVIGDCPDGEFLREAEVVRGGGSNCKGLWSIIEVGRSQAQLLPSDAEAPTHPRVTCSSRF